MIRKGTYLLFLVLDGDREIEAGALGTCRFPAGEYCYAGSAMGGLDQRLSRHASLQKTLRWHIDYLTMAADSAEAYESYPDYIGECKLGHIAESCGCIPHIPGFGCSDCRCATHLFRVPPEAKSKIIDCGVLKLSLHSRQGRGCDSKPL